MKRKCIESIPWNGKPGKDKVNVEVAIHDIKGEKTCIIDLTSSKPLMRVCLTQEDYANYIPKDSEILKNVGEKEGWNRQIFENTYADRRYSFNCSEKNLKKIMKFTKNNWTSPFQYMVSSHERHIKWEKEQRYRDNHLARIEKMFNSIPEPTEAFKQWAMMQVEFNLMILEPFGKRKTTEGVCTKCWDVTEYGRGEIKPKDVITCPHCGARVKVKRVTSQDKRNMSDENYFVEGKSKSVIYLQKTDYGLLERHFTVTKNLFIADERKEFSEYAAVLIKDDGQKTYWKYIDYFAKNKEYWDDKTPTIGMYSEQIKDGPLYTRNINRKMFEGTKYQYSAFELLKNYPDIVPRKYLSKYRTFPYMEMMVKIGLTRLANEMNYWDIPKDVAGKKPWDIFEINKQQFNRLRNINGGMLILEWLQVEPDINEILKDDLLKWLDSNHIYPDNLKFITELMSVVKIRNYVEKQKRFYNNSASQTIQTWEDYLSMAKGLKMNTENEIVFKPKNLKQAHDELVEILGGVAIAKRAAEILKDYPDVNDICQSLKEKYQYNDEHYAIVVPNGIEEIIKEGRKLGHCLDRSDIYFNRIQKKESFIVFLRKMDEVDKPYYTLEIEPDGSTRQKRTLGDKQNDDFQDCVKFIKKWQREIKSRLTTEDKKLAKESAKARVENFKKLRQEQARIWHGHLAGQLLVEVLEADFMAAQ